MAVSSIFQDSTYVHILYQMVKNTRKEKDSFLNIPNYLPLGSDCGSMGTDQISKTVPQNLREYLQTHGHEKPRGKAKKLD